MMNTIPADWLYKNAVGFKVNTGFSDEALFKIGLLQLEIKNKFPDLIWATPQDALHIPLLDIINPFLTYGKEKVEIFGELFTEYDRVLQEIFRNEPRFEIKFSKVICSPEAIIIVGEDNGSFNRMRKKFIDTISSFPGARHIPDIIYATICRYSKGGADLSEIEKFVSDKNIEITEKVNSFRLVHEKVVPMINYEILKIYKLS